MKNNKESIFKVGDIVTHVPDIYGITESEIIEIERLYARYENNSFIYSGAYTLESEIKFISVPFTFDGKTLVVHVPKDKFEDEKTLVSKFKGYVYITKNSKIKVIWEENNLKLKTT